MKKVPAGRVRVPLPRQEPVLQAVGPAVLADVAVDDDEGALVTMVPSSHCEAEEGGLVMWEKKGGVWSLNLL